MLVFSKIWACWTRFFLTNSIQVDKISLTKVFTNWCSKLLSIGGDFLRNMLRCMEYVNSNETPFNEASLGVKPQVFLDISQRCGFTPIFKKGDNEKTVKLRKNGIPIYKLYDKDVSNHFNYVDLSDLHVGHPHFSADVLENCLNKFYKNGKPTVDYVFIAGDLFEGITSDIYSYDLLKMNPTVQKEVEDIRRKQISKICNVLLKYDFDYRVINGNHEYTFEQLGLNSPTRELETIMRKRSKRFTFYDTYVVDFVIAGVVKRMMHLESYCQRDGANQAVDRLNEFKKHGGLKPRYENVPYNIRMFHCGHIHVHSEMYDSANKIFISQSGSFIKDELLYPPIIHMKGIVLDDTRILRD